MAAPEDLDTVEEGTVLDLKVRNATLPSRPTRRQVRYYTITKTKYFDDNIDEKITQSIKNEKIDVDLPETFGDLKPHQQYEEFIYDFPYLRRLYKEKMAAQIRDFHWLTHESDEHLVFYNIDVVDDHARVSTSISLKRNMQPVVALDGTVVDRLEYCALIPVTGKIFKWEQLRRLLVGFGSR